MNVREKVSASLPCPPNGLVDRGRAWGWRDEGRLIPCVCHAFVFDSSIFSSMSCLRLVVVAGVADCPCFLCCRQEQLGEDPQKRPLHEAGLATPPPPGAPGQDPLHRAERRALLRIFSAAAAAGTTGGRAEGNDCCRCSWAPCLRGYLLQLAASGTPSGYSDDRGWSLELRNG